MDQIDTEIAELRRRADDLRSAIADKEQELARVEGEIRGLQRARDLFGSADVVPAAQRHAVKRVVLAKMSSAMSYTEADIVADTGLPAASVHEFLLRAVRQGQLLLDGARYRLPPE